MTEPLTLSLSFSRPLSENNQWEFHGNPKQVLCEGDNLEVGWLGSWEGVQEREDKCVPMVSSC